MRTILRVTPDWLIGAALGVGALATVWLSLWGMLLIGGGV